MPREPLVLGQPRSPISSSSDFTSSATRRTSAQLDAGTGIEIDAQLVGMIEIAGAHRMRMQLDAAQVDDPGEPRRVIDDDLFRGAARRERQRYGSQPRRPLGGRALLIKRLAFGAVDETLENDRTIPDSGERARRDRQVVAHEVELRELASASRNTACPGWVTRTSRPSIESTSAASSFPTKTGYQKGWRMGVTPFRPGEGARFPLPCILSVRDVTLPL